jgi:aspartyl aminopeptidase
MKSSKKEITELLDFLKNAPTAPHAVEWMIRLLHKEGFKELSEGEKWHLAPGKKYYVQRGGSSLCAFITPKKKVKQLILAASHTDSPSFKLKPNAEFSKENMVMLGLEIYGGPLITSWLNRDLGIAGRVTLLNTKGEVEEKLVRCEESPVTIPQLAIHLDRGVNENGLALNKQEHLAALATIKTDKKSKTKPYLEQVIGKHHTFKQLLSHELFLYPLDPPRLIGLNEEMIAAYRIDSLCSVHAILRGLLDSETPANETLKIAAFWDHEEIGSSTAVGAGSPFAAQTIERIALSSGLDREEFFALVHNGACLSVDLSHALHPNYPEKHEPRHTVLMGDGVVLKTNAQQKYSSDALFTGRIAAVCEKYKIPYQKSVARNDIPSGSTIGPIHATLTGMKTVDIGAAQLSMHSIRELASTADHHAMCDLLKHWYAI